MPDYAPLLPTWSLSVEEQLYIVFPPLIVLAARYGRRPLVVFVCGSILAGVTAGMLVNGRANSGFFFPFFRAAEFLIGVLLALRIIAPPRRQWAGDAVAGLGLVLIACAIPLQHRSPYFPADQVLLAAAGTMLVLYGTGCPRLRVSRLLSLRPLVLLGLISYSLYLWHWPMMAFGEYYILDPNDLPVAKFVLAALSVPIAFISWRFVELPFRGPAPLLSRRAAFLSTAGIGLSLIAFAALMLALQGAPARFDPLTRRIFEDRAMTHNPCNGQSALSVAKRELCKLGAPGAEPSFIVLGDSHADMYFEALDALATRYGVLGYMVSEPNCRFYLFDNQPASPDCVARNLEVRNLVRAMRLKAIVMAQRWNVATVAARAQADNDPRGAEWLAAFPTGLERMADFASSAGATLYIVEDIPEATADVTRTLARAHVLGVDPSVAVLHLQPTREEYEALEVGPDAVFADLARRHPIAFLSPADRLCDARTCRVSLDGMPLYRDIHHLNLQGARYAMPAFEPLMRALAKH